MVAQAPTGDPQPIASPDDSRALISAAPVGMALLDSDLTVRLINDRLCEIADIDPDEVVGKKVGEVRPDLAAEIEPLARRVIEERVPVEADHTVVDDGDSPAVLVHAVYFPVDGGMVGVVLRESTDLTDRGSHVAARQRMADSLATADTLRSLERTIIRWARLIPSTVTVHLTTVDPETNQLNHAEMGAGAIRRREADPDTDSALLVPFETGEWTSWSRADLIERFGEVDWLHDSCEMLVGCALATDNTAIVGTLTWQLAEALDPDSPSWELMQSFATTAGTALATMERPELDRRLALAYQQSLLPDELPDVDGLELAADYRSAMDPTRSGGDWYDVVSRRDGATVLIAGDAVGHGIEAAVNMGHVRDVARTAALELSTPSEVLDRVDRHIKELGESMMAAMTVAVVAAGECVVSVALAASPPVVLRHPDGETELIRPAPGPFVGSQLDAEYPTVEHDLEPGATIVLLTDGLIESPEREPDDGLLAVSEMVSTAHDELEGLCSGLLQIVDPENSFDDVVVLAARRHE